MAAVEAAVVTGASSGIGEAIAAALLDRGVPVVALQRSAPKLQHRDLHFRPIDLTDLTATRKVANDVAAEFPVRYLVNNAGARTRLIRWRRRRSRNFSTSPRSPSARPWC